jgi:2-methylcitrate dehydratase PrpD
VPDLARIVERLGEHWEIARNTYKPYPAGIVFHAVIDACLALRDGLGPDDRVLVEGDQLLLDRGDRVLRNERDARVSIHHCAAVALLRGRAGVEDFSGEAVADAALAALRGRVRAGLDAGLPRGAARVTLLGADGSRRVAEVRAPRGSEARPMSDAELEAKFLANGGTPAQAAAAWSLDACPAVERVMRHFAAAAPGG